MSEILKAKQRLLQKSITIMQAPEEEGQFKVFVRTGNASSIPKLHVKQKQLRERSISEIQIEDNVLFRNQVKRLSPKFAKTQRNVLVKSYEYDIKSEKAESINLFGKRKTGNRRPVQYSQFGQIESIGGDMSFTYNQNSVYNQSPIKTVKNTVHGDKLNVIITKLPIRKALSPMKPKQCQVDFVTEMVKQQKSNNSMFTDHMFPPKFTIIFNKKYMYLQEGLKLQRLSKIYEGSQQLRLIKFCQPSLINPSKFTSPALYSALVILSEDPTRVLNLFGNQQYNQNGIYYVQICKDGVWRYIVVDDFLPVKILAKRALLYLHSIAKNSCIQFWPSILQKALAKVYGTYQDIYLTTDKGVKDIFRALTGLPCSEYFINKDFRTYLIIIDTAIKKKQIVVLQSIPQQFKQTAHVKGLQAAQSYQIIQVKKNYIVLRNVADKQLVTKLSFQQVMIFKKLLIFRNQNNYAYISRTLRHKKKCFSTVKVTIKTAIKCYWDIWQNSEVYYKNHIGSHIQYNKSKYMIQIRKQHMQEQTYDSAAQDQVIIESGKQISMNPGTYELLIHLCQNKQQDFTLSYYGEQDVDLVRVKNMEKWPNQCDCE